MGKSLTKTVKVLAGNDRRWLLLPIIDHSQRGVHNQGFNVIKQKRVDASLVAKVTR